jgi:oligoendopeptidase F
MTNIDELPRWSVTDLHESLDAQSFRDAMERSATETVRLVALFDEHNIRAIEPRAVTAADGAAADAVIADLNRVSDDLHTTAATVYASVTTDSRNEQAQSLLGQLEVTESELTPLFARLADWVHALGPRELATVSTEAGEHLGPLLRLAERAAHQMSEPEEGLYAALSTTGSSAWARLQGDLTSQLTATVTFPDGTQQSLPMPAIRGLATNPDAGVRQAAYDAEMVAWPQISTSVAAALNSIKGEANTVNNRRHWDSPLDASLYANSVSRTTFDAMNEAIAGLLPDLRRWMRTKARIHGHPGGLPWSDLIAPLPDIASSISWAEGLDWVRNAFNGYSAELGGLVDRALDEQWIDAAPREGKVGGAFCMSFFDDRSLVLLNWSGSVESAQTTAHELGHAYHNTTLNGRTALQRRLPMALAETASIFCETLAVESGLARLQGPDRLALLDVDLAGTNQVVVDIQSRVMFETEVFARRQRRTLGVSELNELMLDSQEQAYGDGIDLATRHPYMWLLKSHYYASHFYNWPYTYGLMFGLGLYSRYVDDPDKFRAGYADLLSRAGMDTAEQLGEAFDLDVTDAAFWHASADVIRDRITQYEALATELF